MTKGSDENIPDNKEELQKSNTAFSLAQKKMKQEILSSLASKPDEDKIKAVKQLPSRKSLDDNNKKGYKGFGMRLSLPNVNIDQKKGVLGELVVSSNIRKNKLSMVESKKLEVVDIKQETSKSLEIDNEDEENKAKAIFEKKF